MKKVLAIVLAVALSLAIAVPVLAAEVATRDLIIDGGPGDGARTDVGGISVGLTAGVLFSQVIVLQSKAQVSP